MAYAWLCKQRQHYPPNADIWSFRHQSERNISALKCKLLAGEYRLSPMQTVTKQDGSSRVIWCAEDALVLKLLTMALQPVYPFIALVCT
ncbi:hypothetical protein [Vibrio coralliilyticus]|uniref:hypothetical protein n=1 Tax=Vibrio coralliilyticus TaxID=190893 RepID=UPI0020B88207|nr:hypothetical protein [Vibrio coralliilyticus]